MIQARLLERKPPNGSQNLHNPYTVSSDGITKLIVPSVNVMILQLQTSDLVTPEQETLLSVRCAFNGQRVFEVEGGRFAVDDTSYLILNTGQRYSSYIQSETEVEAFNVSCCPYFVEDVLRGMVTPADQLLNVPRLAGEQPVLFFEKTYSHDEVVSPVLFSLRRAVRNPWATRGWLEETFNLLLERLLLAHRNIMREIENLPAMRRSTRAEIYLRLHRAKDFMNASLKQPITLSQIAEVAWLSTHHFLRLFKQTFHETPHQYLTRKRIERAKHLLAHTDLSVTDVCLEVGFESLGSFSWLFRRRVGVSPETFRLQNGNGISRKRIWSQLALSAGG